MLAAEPARANSFAPGVCNARSSSRSIVGYGKCAAPSVVQATPRDGTNSATTASMPSRLVPDMTPANSSRALATALPLFGRGDPPVRNRPCDGELARERRDRGNEMRARFRRDRRRRREREGDWVTRLAADPEFVMQMRPRRPTGLPDIADR